LDFGPFVTHFSAYSANVLIKRLVKDAENNKTPLTSRSEFRQILKEMKIPSGGGEMLQDFSELIDDED
jgi:hypothetical protein